MFISPPEPSEDTQRITAATAKEMGFELNLTKVWAWRPDVYESFALLRNKLTSHSTLTKRDQAVIVCATAAELGDSYCSLAWGSVLSKCAGPSVAAAVISNTPEPTMTGRDQALAAWARKVVDDPNSTTAADVERLRSAGFSEQEIFEITALLAFRLAFSTINDALGVSPDWQLREALAQEVSGVVTFGRPTSPRPEGA